jgi:hypothetical protein
MPHGFEAGLLVPLIGWKSYENEAAGKAQSWWKGARNLY